MHAPTLLTERLVLRPFSLADAPAVQKLAGDEDVARMTRNIPYPYLDGIAETWISSLAPVYEAGNGLTLAICLKESDELAGCLGLRINQADQHGEIGYWVGKPFWGRGYCSEAAQAILDYGFRELELHRIFGYYLTKNPASGKVMAKIGMLYEGCQRGHILKWGVFEDLGLYGITYQDWKKNRE